MTAEIVQDDHGTSPGDPEPVVPYVYDAFISYSSASEYLLARSVEAFLESFHRTKSHTDQPIRPLQICRDGSDFRSRRRRRLAETITEQDPVWAAIRAELERSRYLLVLCSPAAAASPWVAREIQWMVENRGPDAVLPLMAARRTPREPPVECFPAALRAHDLHNKLWYDLRGTYRNYEDELVRLAGDLLEWDTARNGPLGAIWRRERARRQAKILSAAMVGVAALGITIGVAAWQSVVAARERDNAWRHDILRDIESARDPRLAALLLLQLGDHEPEGGLAAAHRIATLPLPRVALYGHRAQITGAVFSSDDQRLLTTSRDGTARIWPTSGMGDPVVLRHSDEVTSASFDTRSAHVVTASNDGYAAVWNAVTGSKELSLPHGAPVTGAQFSHDAAWISTISGDGRGRIWNARTGAPLVIPLPEPRRAAAIWFAPRGGAGMIAADDASVWSFEVVEGGRISIEPRAARPAGDHGMPEHLLSDITFSPGGRYLAIMFQQEAWVYSLSDKVLRPALRHPDFVKAMEFSPDERFLATACGDGKARIWSTASGALSRELDNCSHFFLYDLDHDRLQATEDNALPLREVRFSPDGTHLLTVGGGRLRIWDLAHPADPMDFRLNGGADLARFNGDGTRFATDAADGSVRVWDTTLAEPLTLPHPKSIATLAVDPEHSLVATGCADGVARIWNGITGELFRAFDARAGTVRSVAFSADGRWLLTAHKDGVIRIWDVTGPGVDTPAQRFGEQPGGLLGARFSRDETHVLAWSESGVIRLWSRADSSYFEMACSAGMVWSAAIDRTGTRVLATYEDGTSRMWTVGVQGRFTLLDQAADRKTIYDGAFSPDGLHAVTVGQDGYARIWSTDGGRAPVVVSGPAPGRDWLERVVYRPDGSRIAFTSGDGRAWIIAADGSGSPIALRSHDDLAHDGPILDIAYSDDGTRIATVGGLDDVVRLWQADGRARPIELGRHHGTATRAAFFARGTRLASTSDDGTLDVWVIGWQDLLAFIRSRTTTALRIGERMLYLGESATQARAECQVSELRFFRRHTCDEDPFNYGF